MVAQWLHTFFDWPAGSIWSNIIAWIICGVLAFLWARRKVIEHRELMIAHHEEQMAKLHTIHQHLRASRSEDS